MNCFIREIGYFVFRIKHLLKSDHLQIALSSKATKESKFEGYNKLSHHSYFNGVIGFASYIGDHSCVTGEIGRYCSIAANVMFITATHPIRTFVSSHPCFYSLKKQSGLTYVNEQKFDERPCHDNSNYSISVGNDVYIGYGVTIIGPVKVGDGAVIAANATVVHDVEPYSIVGGVPAKKIGMRFDNETVDFLVKYRWWEKNPIWLRKHADLFENPKKLKEFYEANIEQ